MFMPLTNWGSIVSKNIWWQSVLLVLMMQRSRQGAWEAVRTQTNFKNLSAFLV
jgi:hypothetical protein